MNALVEILIQPVSTITDLAGMILSTLPDTVNLLTGGSTTTLVLLAAAGTVATIPEAVLANIRKWHESIDSQFSCIDNIYNIFKQHPQTWLIPADIMEQLVDSHDRLDVLIKKCKTAAGSPADRTLRNSLLRSTVGFCLVRIKGWAYGGYSSGMLTADDVHSLGFLLPGEQGGGRRRSEPTDVTAEVKVKVVNEDFIRVVIDQSGGENAGLVKHGWPPGVKNALIVLLAADGKTEVYRKHTTHLYNDIQMPEGSHGKQFIAKASFLRHVDDDPRFGNEPTFSMPLTTADLAAALDRQHQEEENEQLNEIERQRQEIERLQAELNQKK
jgi:hypothetical protein